MQLRTIFIAMQFPIVTYENCPQNTEAEVPPTNNHAEQMLRPAVITRKVGGCNKNLLGALLHSILASLMVS
jgi:hypothetical protein